MFSGGSKGNTGKKRVKYYNTEKNAKSLIKTKSHYDNNFS